MKKTCKWAYVLLIISAILMLATNIIVAYNFRFLEQIERYFRYDILLALSFIAYFLFLLAFIVFTILAKKRIWASICALIFCLLTVFMMVSKIKGSYNSAFSEIRHSAMRFGQDANRVILNYILLCLPSLVLGLIGSIKLIVVQSKNRAVVATDSQLVENNEQISAENPQIVGNENITESPKASIPFEHNDADVVKQVLSEEVEELTVYYNDEGYICEQYGYIYSKASGKKKLYAIVAPTIDNIQSSRVVVYDEERNAMVFLSENICELEKKVFEEWRKTVNAVSLSKIEFEDKPIGEKEWKAFKKEASQEELAILAIGSKCMSSGKQFFIRALISVLGTLACIIGGIVGVAGLEESVFGIAIVVGGYVFFNTLAVRLTGYTSTFGDCYKKLTKENKAYVDSFFDDSGVVEFFNRLVEMGLFFFALPYRAILMFIGMMIPSAEDWCVAHGGIGGTVVTLPKGYDIGGLREVGEYYESCKFMDAWDKHVEEMKQEQKAKTKEYEYTDDNGVTHKTYTTDGTNFYSSPSEYTWQKEGESHDGGQTLDTSKK